MISELITVKQGKWNSNQNEDILISVIVISMKVSDDN